MTTLDLAPNTDFAGEFKILRPLRVGGMGAVYVAEQRTTGTLRALKLMQRDLVADKTLRERFEQEARVGASIDSDHVVQVVSAGVDGATGIPWIAMELLDGLPLDLYIATKGARPAGEVRFLFEQLCHALGAAHEKGIIHRDLKPANIFLSTSRVVGLSWMVKVLDFGIAKVLAEAKTARTAAVGTPLYMAPEQYEAGRVSPATDVWALALIAFELLTGKSYWKCARDGQATPASIMYETCLADVTPASVRATELAVEAKLPDGFDAWFARALQKNAEARYANANEAFTALAEVLGPAAPPVEKLPTSARVAAPATQAMDSGTAAMTPAAVATEIANASPITAAATVRSSAAARVSERSSSTAPTSEPNKKRPWLPIAAVAAVALVFFLTRGKKQEETPPPPPESTVAAAQPSASAPAAASPHFAQGSTVAVEGRLLHKNIPPGVRTRTHVMVDLRGGAIAAAKTPPIDLSLVIDRSGSMKGGRLDHAITAAITAMERLRDGDRVSVVAFDQEAQTVVPPTTLDASSRATIAAAIRKITLGGDTCISCGITRALDDLGTGAGRPRRILLLSDGEATAGIKDVAGLEKLAHDAEARDVSITTIGVGQDYDPRALTAIARASNGRHHYASSEAAMPAIFDEEARAMSAVVATETEATIHLQPGVELVSVLDRKHTVSGSIVRVPLGQFASAERKTILLEVAVSPTMMGPLPVANVDVAFRDQAVGKDTHATGALSVLVATGDMETDPVVEARVHRSETASALLEANKLFSAGKTQEAQAVLTKQSSALAAKKKAFGAKPAATAVAADIDAQQKAVDSAGASYGAAAAAAPQKPAAAPAAKAELRKSAKNAYDMGY